MADRTHRVGRRARGLAGRIDGRRARPSPRSGPSRSATACTVTIGCSWPLASTTVARITLVVDVDGDTEHAVGTDGVAGGVRTATAGDLADRVDEARGFEAGDHLGGGGLGQAGELADPRCG